MYNALQVFFCSYIQQEIQEVLWLSILTLWRQFFLNLCSKLILLIIKSQLDFLYDLALDLPMQSQCFSKQYTELFGEHVCRSSRPEFFYEKVEVVVKNFAKFENHLCWSLLFNEVAGWKSESSKHHGTGFVLWIWRSFQEYLFCETPANSCF